MFSPSRVQEGDTTTKINKQEIKASMSIKLPHKQYQNYGNSINISINVLIPIAHFDSFEY